MMQSGGGGGFGNAVERDPELVALDVREGYVSAGVARSVYGVALTDTLQVDVAATEALRRELAADAEVAAVAE